MLYSAKTSLPLYSIGIIYPLPVFRHLSKLVYSFTHIYLYQWGECIKWLSKSPFLAINAKGGENIRPKQKDRTTT
jgi:hypothetical protein